MDYGQFINWSDWSVISIKADGHTAITVAPKGTVFMNQTKVLYTGSFDNCMIYQEKYKLCVRLKTEEIAVSVDKFEYDGIVLHEDGTTEFVIQLN